MNKIILQLKWVGLIFLGCLAIFPRMAFAECGDGANVPAGSYRQTCTNCTTDGVNLTASCKKISQQYNNSTLYSYGECRTGISNADGFLTCNRGDSDAPQGSYMDSCIHINTQKNTLYARCRKVNGQWQESSLALGHCNYRIYNINGVLACSLPYGTYQHSCRNSRVQNNTLYAECRTRNGEWIGASVSAQCNRDISNDNGILKCT